MATSTASKPRKRQYQNVHHGSNEDGGMDRALSTPDTATTNGTSTIISNRDEVVVAEATVEMSVDDAIDRLGMGLFQYRILLAAGLCFAADAMEVLLLSFLSIVLRDEWGLSDDETAFITSILFAGALIGTSILGPLADQWGRRPVFLLAVSMIALFGTGTSLVNNYEQLLIIMFIIGFGVGGLTVPFDTLAEFLPAKGRGYELSFRRLVILLVSISFPLPVAHHARHLLHRTNLLLIEYFWTLGCLLVIVFAELTLAHGKANWRLFVILCSLPCFLSIAIGWLYVPESVRWLVSTGRNEEALEILRHAGRINKLTAATPLSSSSSNNEDDDADGTENVHDNHEDSDDIMDAIFPWNTELTSEEDHSAENSASCTDLIKPQWRGTMLKLWGAWGGFGIAYYGSIQSITKIFDVETPANVNSTLTFDSGDNSTITSRLETNETADFDYGAIFISSSAELLGTTFVILLVDRVGRIPSQVVSYALAGVCIFAMCILADSSHGAASERWEVVGLGFLLRAFDMAGTCTSWVMTAEVLSTEIRTTGHASANAIARLGAFFSPFIVDTLNLRVLGIVMLVIHWFTAACVSQLPETKGGHMGGGGGGGVGGHNALVENNDDDEPAYTNQSEVDENEEPDGLFVIDDDDDDDDEVEDTRTDIQTPAKNFELT